MKIINYKYKLKLFYLSKNLYLHNDFVDGSNGGISTVITFFSDDLTIR